MIDSDRLGPIFGASPRHHFALTSKTLPRFVEYGAPTMIRTWDPQIRNLVLYPTELPGPACRDSSKESGHTA